MQKADYFYFKVKMRKRIMTLLLAMAALLPLQAQVLH